MTWRLECECGTELAAASEDELVRAAEAHLAHEHPALRTLPGRGDLLAMAQEVDDGAADGVGSSAARATDGEEA